MATLIEVAARNQMLKNRGIYTARELQRKHEEEAGGMTQMRMVVVTGLSGSGRSAALKAFEDMGYYCVDNLPLVLLPDFVDFARSSEEAVRSAIGIDIREKDFPSRFPALLPGAQERAAVPIEMLFLDASDQTLVRRFSETGRPHPLARGATPLIDGIRQERAALAEVQKAGGPDHRHVGLYGA